MPLYLSCSRSDRDKASLHKVAGRTRAGAQQHSTCQQSHRATGMHSSWQRLPAFYFLFLSLSGHSFIHSFLINWIFSPFSIYDCFFSNFSSSSLPLPHWKRCILLSSCLLGSGWKAGIECSGVLLSGFPHRVYNPLDVLEGGTVFEQPYSMYVLCKVSRNREKQWWCICRNIQTITVTHR